MNRVPRLAAAMMILMGCAHLAATVVLFDAFTESALWFASGGIMMTGVGALNLLSLGPEAGRAVSVVTRGMNMAAAVFMILLWEVTRALQPLIFLGLIVIASLSRDR